ncbi:MAG: tyrosine-protein phosphatase, partial [Clostridium sp.]
MVDLHSHILWGIDDGAKDREMTLQMLRQAKASGTKKIVATPHYLRDRYEVKYDELVARYDDVKKLIDEEKLDLEVFLAQEVYFADNILEMYNNKEIGTINGGKYMLVELPMREFSTTEVIDKLYELQVKGIEIIIAHPERYKPFVDNPGKINRFIEEGYLFQLNAGSIAGEFGKDVQKLA